MAAVVSRRQLVGVTIVPINGKTLDKRDAKVDQLSNDELGGPRVLKCDHCSMTFTQTGSLRGHLRRKHKKAKSTDSNYETNEETECLENKTLSKQTNSKIKQEEFEKNEHEQEQINFEEITLEELDAKIEEAEAKVAGAEAEEARVEVTEVVEAEEAEVEEAEVEEAEVEEAEVEVTEVEEAEAEEAEVKEAKEAEVEEAEEAEVEEAEASVTWRDFSLLSLLATGLALPAPLLSLLTPELQAHLATGCVWEHLSPSQGPSHLSITSWPLLSSHLSLHLPHPEEGVRAAIARYEHLGVLTPLGGDRWRVFSEAGLVLAPSCLAASARLLQLVEDGLAQDGRYFHVDLALRLQHDCWEETGTKASLVAWARAKGKGVDMEALAREEEQVVGERRSREHLTTLGEQVCLREEDMLEHLVGIQEEEMFDDDEVMEEFLKLEEEASMKMKEELEEEEDLLAFYCLQNDGPEKDETFVEMERYHKDEEDEVEAFENLVKHGELIEEQRKKVFDYLVKLQARKKVSESSILLDTRKTTVVQKSLNSSGKPKATHSFEMSDDDEEIPWEESDYPVAAWRETVLEEPTEDQETLEASIKVAMDEEITIEKVRSKMAREEEEEDGIEILRTLPGKRREERPSERWPGRGVEHRQAGGPGTLEGGQERQKGGQKSRQERTRDKRGKGRMGGELKVQMKPELDGRPRMQARQEKHKPVSRVERKKGKSTDNERQGRVNARLPNIKRQRSESPEIEVLTSSLPAPAAKRCQVGTSPALSGKAAQLRSLPNAQVFPNAIIFGSEQKTKSPRNHLNPSIRPKVTSGQKPKLGQRTILRQKSTLPSGVTLAAATPRPSISRAKDPPPHTNQGNIKQNSKQNIRFTNKGKTLPPKIAQSAKLKAPQLPSNKGRVNTTRPEAPRKAPVVGEVLLKFISANVVEGAVVAAGGARILSFSCKLCSFGHSNRFDLENHIESLHSRVTASYPCDLCDKVESTRAAYYSHGRRKHGVTSH